LWTTPRPIRLATVCFKRAGSKLFALWSFATARNLGYRFDEMMQSFLESAHPISMFLCCWDCGYFEHLHDTCPTSMVWIAPSYQSIGHETQRIERRAIRTTKQGPFSFAEGPPNKSRFFGPQI
jgi:hypothetical protein